LEHTYRGKNITVTAVLPTDSDRWTALIVISVAGSTTALGHPVGTFCATAAEAEWEGVIYAMKWIDAENRT
jgi:hypothetical protein